MSSVETIGRMLLALSVVLLVLWIIGRAVRRTRRPADDLVDVLARKQLSRNAAVAVVRVADRAMVIGLTDTSVSLIAETDLAAVERAAEPRPAAVAAAVSVPAAVPVVPVAANGMHPRRAPRAPATAGALAGSALSPATWKQSVDVLRELTVRRA